jgi:excinuclease ABC subunit A
MDLVCPGTMFDLQCCTGARYFAKCGSDVSTANSTLRDLQAIERSMRVLQNVPDTPRQIGGDMTELKSITIRGAREHNLKNVDLDLPRNSLIVMTGLSGLGQVLARLRHDLCRGPAPLCRKPVGLCAAVSRDDAEARCRPDRRAVAGHFHRAEDHQPQPALDRRHRDRDLRLHAAAVRPRRRALFARHRPADRKPDRQPDGRPGDGAGRRHAALPAGAGGARAQGRVPQGTRRLPHEAGLPAGQDRRRSITRSPMCRRSTRSSSTTSTWWWTGSWCARTSPTRLADSFETALKLADGLAIAEFADKPLPTRKDRRAGSAQENALIFLERFACPESGFTIPEIEPRLFSFNNPQGACPTCDGLGTTAGVRRGADRARSVAVAAPRRGGAWAKTGNTSPYYTQTLEAICRTSASWPSPGATCPKRCRM